MIPEMTDPSGRSWRQPPRNRIIIDDTHALMSQRDFSALHEYSTSTPTGVYPGKMWRRHDGAYDRTCPPEHRRWLLCWYGEVADNPSVCSINFREILLHDAADPNSGETT